MLVMPAFADVTIGEIIGRPEIMLAN
jgi:hypothetical protein